MPDAPVSPAEQAPVDHTLEIARILRLAAHHARGGRHATASRLLERARGKIWEVRS